MAELGFDMLLQILIRLNLEDLIQCKRVCKSWYSFVSDPCFVESHLNRSYANDLNTYGQRKRIIMPESGSCRIVGSANGLVCVSLNDYDRLLVTNPWTREVKLLPPPLYFTRSSTSCWGFGYDSSIDDYKVIVGCTRNEKDHTRFYVFSLKSNVWRLIDRVMYMLYLGSGKSGILCDGGLHWLMRSSYRENEKIVILSLDLSSEEFKEIPLPDHHHDSFSMEETYRLGCSIRGCLCIYNHKSAISESDDKSAGRRKYQYQFPISRTLCSSSNTTWVMRNCNAKQSWELYQLFDHEINPDAVHYLKTPPRGGVREGTVDHLRCLDTDWVYASAPIFVQSLVSPYIGGRQRLSSLANIGIGETTDRAIANSSLDDVSSGSFPFSHGILESKRKW
uniref:F-box/kelch-repeat protein At3g06240-like n=1 Tax=Erigeron canadensis TaxID=72917 RepID=UPI001CB9B156|nr:F-box/kelch-repeat protein At3g06240-like [Erigeron canadensis]